MGQRDVLAVIDIDSLARGVFGCREQAAGVGVDQATVTSGVTCNATLSEERSASPRPQPPADGASDYPLMGPALCALAVSLARCDLRRQGAFSRAVPAWPGCGWSSSAGALGVGLGRVSEAVRGPSTKMSDDDGLAWDKGSH